MRENYNAQLKTLNEEMASFGSLCETAIAQAIQALRTHDIELAKKTYQNDFVIDQKERSIENLCLQLILQQQPIAGDLHLISASLKMITDIERIGDQASDIAEIVMNLDYAEEGQFKLIYEMADIAISMVNDSIKAFVNRDHELAKAVEDRDDQLDDLLRKSKHNLSTLITEHGHNADTILDLLMISKYLERIGDHACNVAQWVIFCITGEHEKHEAS